MRVMRRRGLRLAVAAAVAVVGCRADESAQGGDLTVLDSAGVTVKEYAAPMTWAAPITLREVTRIGTVDGPPPTLFTSIPGGRILDDGRLVLVDRGALEVRVFSPEGQFLQGHGREGQGPGEYEYIIGVGQCAPEGFTVFDIGWTMSFYDAAGEFVREQVTRLDGGSTPYHLTCDSSGRLAVVNWDLDMYAEGPPLGFHTAPAQLRILGPDGAGSLDLGERIGSERFGRPTGSGPHPAGRSTKFGFSGSDLIVSDGSFFGFERWGAEGRMTEIVRIGDVPPPDIDSLMSAYLDWTLARASTDEQRTRWRAQVSEMTGPERAAYFSDLFVSADHVLLRELNVGSTGRWFAFDIDGMPRGYLPLPPGAQLLDFRDGLLLVSVRDEMDVVSAVLYEVEASQ